MDVDDDTLAGGDVPSIEGIQQTLVNINDKPSEFLHSTDWLGALEVSERSQTKNWQTFLNGNWIEFISQIFYVIDTLYDVPCRIQHIPCNQDIRKYSNIIKFHFENFGGLIMMGGDMDASSKGIVGIHIVDNDAYLLIVVSVHSHGHGHASCKWKSFVLYFLFVLFLDRDNRYITHFWWIIFLYQTPLSPKSFWVNCVCERNREEKIVASACALSDWPRTVVVVVHCAMSVWLPCVRCPVSCVMRNANEGWGMGYVETGSGFTAFRL